MKIFFPLIILFFSFFLSQSGLLAQVNGSISGKVLDKDKKPVEFANIALVRAGDSTAVKGGISDANGDFKIVNVPFGKYELQFFFVGYQRKILKDVTVTAQSPFVKLDNVELAEDARQLSEIVIEQKQEFIQTNSEGITIKPDANLTQVGGTATDVLRNAPSVNVDANGNITLRGASPNILINGRNSGMAGGGMMRGMGRFGGQGGGLDQILAEDIESIEISNNPGARFDAEGMGGLINIRLKRDRQLGTHAAFNAGMGNRLRYNTSIRVNHREKKWNIFGSYNLRRDKRLGSNELDRTTYLPTGLEYLDQDGSQVRRSFSQNFRMGYDYYFSDKEQISLEAGYGFRSNRSDEITQSLFLNENLTLTEKQVRNNDETGNGHNFEGSVLYKKELAKPKQEVSLSWNSSVFTDYEKSDLLDEFSDGNGLPLPETPDPQRTINYSKNAIHTFQADYAHPLSKNAILETGYKGVFRSLNNNFDFDRLSSFSGQWENDDVQSNDFLYEENVHAAYVQYRSKWNKLDYSAGIRVEQVWLKGISNVDTRFNKDYFNIFPSARLAYNFKETESLKLSYTRRINRPNFFDLNPFRDISNPLAIRTGNPDLNPELLHSLEFSYNRFWEKIVIIPSLFYRRKNSAIQRVVTIDDQGIALFRPQNIGFSETYGFEMITTVDIKKWWNINLSYSYFNTNVDGGNQGSDELNSSATSWNTKLISSFTLPKDFKIQVNSGYYSPVAQAQGTNIARYSTDIAISKSILNKKGNLVLNFSDIFYTLRFGGNTFGSNFEQTTAIQRDTRMVMLNFRYRI